ncbi:hypothetical protein ARC63_19970 [Stenotrophomonas geniculata ATCC 19374 = JCM 13324]|nr:hypothetical protein ARC63_19970 [Stenotrophomonas geniculata ATCC 19374 = JCM 13324]
MACFIVSFEVKDPQTVLDLREKLKSYKTYCPITATCWAIVADQKAAEIRDELGEILKPGDRIFVLRSGTEGAWKNTYGKANSEWLKKHL